MDKEILRSAIINQKSFIAISKDIGISADSVSKLAKKYGYCNYNKYCIVEKLLEGYTLQYIIEDIVGSKPAISQKIVQEIINNEELQQKLLENFNSKAALEKFLGLSKRTVATKLGFLDFSTKKNLITEQIRKSFIDLNYNITEVARLHSCSRTRVINATIDLMQNAVVTSIKELAEDGKSIGEISTIVNKPIEYVKEIFSRFNLICKTIDINKDILLDLVNKKIPTSKIATQFDVRISYIYDLYEKYGIDRPHHKEIEITYEDLFRLYKVEKRTSYEIADMYNCSSTGIQHKLQGLNIEPNSINDYPCKVSKPELELKEVFNKYRIEYIHGSFNIIPPVQLDFFLPNYNIAIEYCGLYWHSTYFDNRSKFHIVEKYNKCLESGIRLITIFSDEYIFKKEIVIDRLLHILQLKTYPLYARECLVKQISSRDGINFLNNHHLQGAGSNSIYLGAYYDDSLISVMSFSKPNPAKGSFNATWELNRFASSYPIIGIANKLLNFFENTYDWQSIISYCDKRWNTGEIYTKLGFTKLKDSFPNYWYTKGDKRFHRWNFTKQKLLSLYPESNCNLTEEQIAENVGLYRIYDCGNMRFIKIKEKS